MDELRVNEKVFYRGHSVTVLRVEYIGNDVLYTVPCPASGAWIRVKYEDLKRAMKCPTCKGIGEIPDS